MSVLHTHYKRACAYFAGTLSHLTTLLSNNCTVLTRIINDKLGKIDPAYRTMQKFTQFLIKIC